MHGPPLRKMNGKDNSLALKSMIKVHKLRNAHSSRLRMDSGEWHFLSIKVFNERNRTGFEANIRNLKHCFHAQNVLKVVEFKALQTCFGWGTLKNLKLELRVHESDRTFILQAKKVRFWTEKLKFSEFKYLRTCSGQGTKTNKVGTSSAWK